MYDIVIIGGGAAGLAAGIMLARQNPQARIAVLEKAQRTGRKLIVTGSGTCNLSNMAAEPSHYHGDGASSFVQAALAAFPPNAALDFFQSVGVACRIREDRRVYPLTESAAAVLDCLRLELAGLGVQEIVNCPVTAIRRTEGGFTLDTPHGAISATYVVAAMGGAAAPTVGGSAEGYRLLEPLGHKRTPLFPSIVQVKTDTTLVRSLKGIRVNAEVCFCHNGLPISHCTDELLFTEYGISGPAVMHASRCVGDWERSGRGTMTAVIDFLPDIPAQQVWKMLRSRRALLGRTMEDYLTGLLPKRVGQTLLRASELFSVSRPSNTLDDAELERLTAVLKGWQLSVIGTTGMGGAQVTAGGICLSEVDPVTMQSRLAPGLFLIGELLDVDGDCGGFNLQWAWASANAVARAIGK